MPKLPIGSWIDAIIAWSSVHLSGLFAAITAFFDAWNSLIQGTILQVPPIVVVTGLVLIGCLRRHFQGSLIQGFALLLVWNLGYWHDAIETVSLVLIAAGLSTLAGIPLGIAIAESKAVRSIVTPILDYMQTTPSFVYLIPSVLFLGIGVAPAVVATIIFALPPVVRATALGIDSIDHKLIEAAYAFGSSPGQVLRKVKLPLALPYVYVGINQCIMMSLAMVVICALIGAQGLGSQVVSALAQADLAKGIEAGTAIVLLAIVLDHATRPRAKRSQGTRWWIATG